MYLPNAISENIDHQLNSVIKHTSDLLAKLTFDSSKVLFQRGSDFSALASSDSNFYLLLSGQLELKLQDKTLLIYEKGDLVGLEALLPIESSCLARDFAVEVAVIPREKIEKQLGLGQVNSLLADFAALFMTALAANLPNNNVFEPECRRYEAGEVIVEQGTFGEDIFTLVEGHADVYVDGNKVGEVKTDEVFGALAAMTNIGRTATIISTGNSLVLGLKKDRLLELIKLRPGTVEKLIGDLARVIQDQNKRLTELS